MSEHTPGPWTARPQTGPQWGVTHGDSEFAFICNCFTLHGNDEANARLIAAAPDMLEALKQSLDWLSSYPGGGALGMYDQVRAAIEKATVPINDNGQTETK